MFVLQSQPCCQQPLPCSMVLNILRGAGSSLPEALNCSSACLFERSRHVPSEAVTNPHVVTESQREHTHTIAMVLTFYQERAAHARSCSSACLFERSRHVPSEAVTNPHVATESQHERTNEHTHTHTHTHTRTISRFSLHTRRLWTAVFRSQLLVLQSQPYCLAAKSFQLVQAWVQQTSFRWQSGSSVVQRTWPQTKKIKPGRLNQR